MKKKMPKNEWDRFAGWWDRESGDKGLWHQQHDINPVIFPILGKVKNKKILEIGCANGYLSRILAKKGAKVVGIDLSPKLISFAVNKEKIKPLNIKYLVRDAAHLDGLKSKSFDIVIANMCLMDMTDAAGAIKEAARVLKQGGLFLFSITHPVFHDSPWITIKKGKKKFFARTVFWYKLPRRQKLMFFSLNKKITQYHRPIEFYIKGLIDQGFKLIEFNEIVTKKKVKKATPQDGDIRFLRSRYKTLSEKKIKEVASKEIPFFLVVGAVKQKKFL